MKRQVSITGMGIISSIGDNIEEFEQSLRMGRSGIRQFEFKTEAKPSVEIGAVLRDFSFIKALQKLDNTPEEIFQKAKQAAQRAPITIQTSTISALEAWHSAQPETMTVGPERIGVIVAAQSSTANYKYELMSKFQNAPEYLTPRYALHYLTTDQVGMLSEIFTIQGEGYVVGGASASGNLAIIKGFQAIQSGLVDVCMVVGVMADLSPMDMQGFVNIGAMGGKVFKDRPEEACRPFDHDHEGFIFGQSAGTLILEAKETAAVRGVKELAEIAAGSLNLDGCRLSEPNVGGEVTAMNSSLNQAGMAPDWIDYLNTHGTASPLGDETEIAAIHRVFGNHVPKLWLNSTKGLTGHCLFSAGVVEAIATVIQMQKGFVHPNLNLADPIDPDCRFCGAKAEEATINTAMSNSFGFGGINTNIILKKAD